MSGRSNFSVSLHSNPLRSENSLRIVAIEAVCFGKQYNKGIFSADAWYTYTEKFHRRPRPEMRDVSWGEFENTNWTKKKERKKESNKLITTRNVIIIFMWIYFVVFAMVRCVADMVIDIGAQSRPIWPRSLRRYTNWAHKPAVFRGAHSRFYRFVFTSSVRYTIVTHVQVTTWRTQVCATTIALAKSLC